MKNIILLTLLLMHVKLIYPHEGGEIAEVPKDKPMILSNIHMKKLQNIIQEREALEEKDFSKLNLDEAQKSLKEIQKNKAQAEYLKNIVHEATKNTNFQGYEIITQGFESEYQKLNALERKLLNSQHMHDLAFTPKNNNPEPLPNDELTALGLEVSFEPSRNLKTASKTWNKLKAQFREAELWIRKKVGDEAGAKKTADTLIKLYHFLEDDLGKMKAGVEKLNLEKDAEEQMGQFRKLFVYNPHISLSLAPEQIKAITPEQIKAITPEQIKAITPEQFLKLTPKQVAQFSPEQKEAVILEQIQETAALEIRTLAVRDASQLSEINRNMIVNTFSDLPKETNKTSKIKKKVQFGEYVQAIAQDEAKEIIRLSEIPKKKIKESKKPVKKEVENPEEAKKIIRDALINNLPGSEVLANLNAEQKINLTNFFNVFFTNLKELDPEYENLSYEEQEAKISPSMPRRREIIQLLKKINIEDLAIKDLGIIYNLDLIRQVILEHKNMQPRKG